MKNKKQGNVNELRKKKRTLNKKIWATSALLCTPLLAGMAGMGSAIRNSMQGEPVPPAYYEAYNEAKETLSALEKISKEESNSSQDLLFSLREYVDDPLKKRESTLYEKEYADWYRKAGLVEPLKGFGYLIGGSTLTILGLLGFKPYKKMCNEFDSLRSQIYDEK